MWGKTGNWMRRILMGVHACKSPRPTGNNREISGFVAIVADRLWGETAAKTSFLFTLGLIPLLLGLE